MWPPRFSSSFGLLILLVIGARSSTTDELEAVKYLESLEPKYSEACNKQTEARWSYITNVNNETEHNSVSQHMHS